ncbi:MAG: hypothetical protein E7015_01465 [Alphaproteobacteria bacterium]|nr:hypothetical protein [Alphaproteobacteria bacterium]
MNKKIVYLLSLLSSAFTFALGVDVTDSIVRDIAAFNGMSKGNITHEDTSVEWIAYTKPLNLLKSTAFEFTKADAELIFSRLTKTQWMVGSTEVELKVNGARGTDRPWKGDISKSIGANIWVPTSVLNGNKEMLELIMHRAISIAVYNVIVKYLRRYAPETAHQVKLKWINDVIINGKKICGIKPDDFNVNPNIVSYQFAMNINMPREELDKVDQPATSLSVECNTTIDRESVFKDIVTEIIKTVKNYKDNLEDLDKIFSSKMAFIGDEVIVYDATLGKNIEGVLEVVSRGKIFIRQSSGQLAVIEPGYGILRKKEMTPKKESLFILRIWNNLRDRFCSLTNN